MHGVRIPRAAILNPEARETWLQQQDQAALASQLRLLWVGYDATRQQVKQAKHQLVQLSKKYEIITYWKDLPGFGLIRSVTLFAYLDTPWRFKKKTKLCRYRGTKGVMP